MQTHSMKTSHQHSIIMHTVLYLNTVQHYHQLTFKYISLIMDFICFLLLFLSADMKII